MGKIIQFYIVPTNSHLHKDLIMELSFLDKIFFFDTYYYWDGDFLTDTYEHLSNVIKEYLEKCKTKILELNQNEVIYLPLDFSDEYYGAFKVILLEMEDFLFEYGTVDKTNQVFFFEENEKFGLLFKDQNPKFDVDFSFRLNKSEVFKSFSLISSDERKRIE